MGLDAASEVIVAGGGLVDVPHDVVLTVVLDIGLSARVGVSDSADAPHRSFASGDDLGTSSMMMRGGAVGATTGVAAWRWLMAIGLSDTVMSGSCAGRCMGDDMTCMDSVRGRR